MCKENQKVPLFYKKIDDAGVKAEGSIKTFDTGATRGNDENKMDYEGFMSPIVLERYAKYLHKHRIQADGKIRDSDNWQKGMSKTTYIKSLWRHFIDVWKSHRGYWIKENIQDALCGVIFNAMGYLYELLRGELPKTDAKKEIGYLHKPLKEEKMDSIDVRLQEWRERDR